MWKFVSGAVKGPFPPADIYNYRGPFPVAGVGVVNRGFDNYRSATNDVAGAGGVMNRLQFQITAPAPFYGLNSWVVSGIPQPVSTFVNQPQVDISQLSVPSAMSQG